MARLIILGATGSLGGHVLRQALDAGHEVTVFVRSPARLAADAHRRASIYSGDLGGGLPAEIVAGQDVLINCAGHVRDGDGFAGLVDRVITTVDALPASDQPVCWFLAGAALLDIGTSGRRGVDLPEVAATYWPHRANFERLNRSRVDWRLLCPGPMVNDAPLGIERLRVSLDILPVDLPPDLQWVPGASLAAFASLVPRLSVSYANAAALMLANVDPDNAMSRRRVGLAPDSGWRR